MNLDNKDQVECIPNICEGRDQSKIDQFVGVIKNHQNIDLVHVDSGHAANRSVFTLIGELPPMLNCLEELYSAAKREINLSRYESNHPFIGAIDVCPFVAVKKTQEDLLIREIKIWARKLSDTLKIPICFYAKSSLQSPLRTLPQIRKGGYQKLVVEQNVSPNSIDLGSEFLDTDFGISVVGVRDFMVAYNVNLETQDLRKARRIASEMRRIREEKGIFAGISIQDLQIKAWYVEEYNCCQITTNIHDTRNVSPWFVFSFSKEIALQFGVKVKSSELIGMLPKHSQRLLSNELNTEEPKEISKILGLGFNGPFNVESRFLPV